MHWSILIKRQEPWMIHQVSRELCILRKLFRCQIRLILKFLNGLLKGSTSQVAGSGPCSSNRLDNFGAVSCGFSLLELLIRDGSLTDIMPCMTKIYHNGYGVPPHRYSRVPLMLSNERRLQIRNTLMLSNERRLQIRNPSWYTDSSLCLEDKGIGRFFSDVCLLSI